jgi:VWFA-related protein
MSFLKHAILAVAAPLALVIFAAVLEAPSAAQSGDQRNEVVQSDTVLRANTRLVLTDVVATDGNGKPLTDLKLEDFKVLENGRPQQVAHFSFHQPLAQAASRTLTLPPDIVTNMPAYTASSMNVILFDSANGDASEHAYARDQLLKFLATAEIHEPLAIFALHTDLKLLHDFTMDGKALHAAVAAYKPPASFQSGESIESRASAFSNNGNFHTNERNIETTLNQLNALAKVLIGYPGRKNLIWLSESFPLDLFPDIATQVNMSGQDLRSAESSPTGGQSSREKMQNSGDSKSYAALVKKVSDALMNAHVSIYPVDAGGLSKDNHLAAQNTMNDMAAWTGGRVFLNRNDLAIGMKNSLDDGSVYYTLEYYPDNKQWDGQFRAIKVSVDRPGINLRYREGYYAVDPAKIAKDESDRVAEDFSRSLQADSPAATAILFQAQVTPPSGKNNKVLVTFHVDPKTLTFDHKDDGHESTKLSCTVWAYGKDKNKPFMSKADTVTANLSREEYQLMMKQQFFPCKGELELKAGSYQLRLGVLDRTSNRMGTASATVMVPLR